MTETNNTQTEQPLCEFNELPDNSFRELGKILKTINAGTISDESFQTLGKTLDYINREYTQEFNRRLFSGGNHFKNHKQ